jgi:hypothetical protein
VEKHHSTCAAKAPRHADSEIEEVCGTRLIIESIGEVAAPSIGSQKKGVAVNPETSLDVHWESSVS